MNVIDTQPTGNETVLDWGAPALALAAHSQLSACIADATQPNNCESSRRRFTLDGSDALEYHLRRTGDRVGEELQAAIPSRLLKGVVLGGGYGRGEGGVLRTRHGDQPYNDLEFYILLGGGSRLLRHRLDRALHPVRELLSSLAGLEVEFKLLAHDALRRSEPTMFYYDLVMGHRWILGDDSLLDGCGHHRDARRLPLHEATRLWMNRASGLLFATERLRRETFSPGDADYVGRNLAKARLAWGDIVLAALGQYHWSCRERNRRLHALRATTVSLDLPALVRLHDAGVEFKLHPVRSRATRALLEGELGELTRCGGELLLWLENRRLGTSFSSLRGYALSGVNRCPETSACKNWLVTVQALGARAALSLSAVRYPRERLLDSLALLLDPNSGRPDARDLAFLQQRLNTQAVDLGGLVAAHETLWRRFG